MNLLTIFFVSFFYFVLRHLEHVVVVICYMIYVQEFANYITLTTIYPKKERYSYNTRYMQKVNDLLGT